MLTAEMTKNQLKDEIINSLDKLDKDDFVELYDFIARKAADKLVESVTQKWDAGLVTAEDIEEAKQEHRSKHPYRA